MIVEYFFNLIGDLLLWVISLMGTWTPPDWLTSAGSTISSATSALSGLSPWVNWSLLNAVLAATAASWVLFGKLKLLRTGVSALPTGSK